MTYCYTPMDSPDFFGGLGDCEKIKHDLRAKNGGLDGGNELTSAIIIQMNTHAGFEGENGWWGDQFERYPLGNKLWLLTGKNSDQQGMTAKMDEYIRAALRPLIAQNAITKLDIRAVRTIDGAEASVDITTPNGDTLGIII